MFSPRKPARFQAGVIGAALICAAGLTLPVLGSNDIDPITTGSISSQGASSSTNPGSPGFRRILDVLATGDMESAYQMAKSLPDDIERRAIQWAAIYFGNGAVDHDSVLRFEADAPSYASASVYHTRLEQALIKEKAGDDEIIKLLGGAMPDTIAGQIALAVAYKHDGQTARAARIARSIWVDNFLDRASEDKARTQLGDLLTHQDQWDRAVHLLMNDRAAQAERLLDDLSPAEKTLAAAGIAVARGQPQARPLLDKVDPSLRHNALFYFLSAKQARTEQRWGTAVADLDAPGGEVPDAAQWWYERRSLLRELLARGEVKLAYQAAAGYRHGPEGRLVDAHFQAGWVALAFLHDARTAREQFEEMRKISTVPDSITQANFWLGRAETALGNAEEARKAFETAAKFGTTYYGLLARAQLGDHGIDLRPMPSWQSDQAAFDSHELTKAVRLLAANGHPEMAVPLLRKLAFDLKDGGQLLLAARLAQALDANQLAISIADIADRRGTPLDLFSFPKDGVPADAHLASIDKAAIYAVARQESRFQVDAVSSAGARGIMQLMPATARETAQTMGLTYSPSKLTSDAAYNLQLGSNYLASQLDRFNGSLVLAAAAYNAGASNAAKWIAAYGDPRAANVDTVLWIELIPFTQTRDYVQRVLANYMVYRARLGKGDLSIYQALKRIPD